MCYSMPLLSSLSHPGNGWILDSCCEPTHLGACVSCRLPYLPAGRIISTEAVFPSSYLHRKVTQPRSGGNIPWGSIHKLEMRDERELVGTFFCLFLPGNNRSLLGSEGQLRSSTAHTPSLFAHLPCFVSFFPHTSFPGLHTSIKNQHITFSLSLCF